VGKQARARKDFLFQVRSHAAPLVHRPTYLFVAVVVVAAVAVAAAASPSPALESLAESLSTLKFANRAKNIKNEARVNEDLDQKSLLRK